jgi:uncharacterized protein (DUF2384 family)
MKMEPSDMFLLQKSAGRAGEILGLTEWYDDAKLLNIWSQLSAMLGSDPAPMQHWIQTPNKHLDGRVPANLVTKERGIDDIMGLLSSFSY